MVSFVGPLSVGILAIISILITSYLLSGWVAIYLSPPYGFSDIPDLTGKVAVVTGANTGIGYITARELARKGARVIATSRSTINAEEARRKINQVLEDEKSLGSIEFLQLDFSSLAKVKNATDIILSTVSKIDILILNAGVMSPPFEKTVDGYELTIATNHLGHFLLVKRLLSMLTQSKSRIVHVSSVAHHFSYDGGIDFRTFTDQSLYRELKSYGQSKLANILFSNELAKQLEGSGATSNALHPGTIKTSLQRHINPSFAAAKDVVAIASLLYYLIVNMWLEDIIFMPTEQGAYNQLFVATSPTLRNINGKYFNPIGTLVYPLSHALNVTLQKQLWEVSDEITKSYQ